MTHLDASILSAYAEGLLRTRKRARVASHLAACPACARTLQQLAGVTELLAAVPAPPMPVALAERLDSALAAESSRRRADAAAAGAGSGATSPGAAEGGGAPAAAGLAAGTGARDVPHRDLATRRGRGSPRSARFPLAARLVTATAVLALLGGGGYLISQTAGSTDLHGTSAGGSAAVSRPTARLPAAGAANAPNLDAGDRVIASGTSYQPGTLARQVQAVLARFRFGYEGIPVAPSPAKRTSGTGQLAACAAAVPGRRPVLIDLARYAGKPAVVIVTQMESTREAWVLPRDCTAGHASVIARTALPG